MAEPADPIYPIMYLDALQIKVRDGGHVRNKAIYVAIGVTIEGNKEVLVDRADRRSEVLAANCDRAEEPRGAGHSDRLC